MVNTSLKELKRYLTGFDQVVKERTIATAITEGTWGLNIQRLLLAQAIDNDIVKTVVNVSLNEGCETVNECQKCLELKTELLNKKDFVDKETYKKLCKNFMTLEKHCITLEADSQLLMKVIPDEEEVAVDAIPLATKPPSIVNWKIVKEGKISYYQIIRVDGSSRRYSTFIQMLRSFDREDLETLWKLVKAKHGRCSVEESTGKQSDHLGKFDAKADDGYFLGYSFVSKAFRVFNTRRQQIEETYHVTFGESMEAIRFTHTSKDEIGIDDSSRYPPDEFVHEDDPSRQYQIDSDISYC
ncbi:retrovirus-related pol polyprotein from transposon TNT 1-94 [Tanacetum coccineum]|uniref:Retrovirus-related pol polyprotein from transposon TNT 1-94 n=1 Tax=Tanacetum coccineum TaxID=301880 RepID=A0ABQ5E3N3_9ASTR